MSLNRIENILKSIKLKKINTFFKFYNFLSKIHFSSYCKTLIKYIIYYFIKKIYYKR